MLKSTDVHSCSLKSGLKLNILMLLFGHFDEIGDDTLNITAITLKLLIEFFLYIFVLFFLVDSFKPDFLKFQFGSAHARKFFH
jgi:hypothetical protein